MSKKTPDTRNKLDSNKGINKRTKRKTNKKSSLKNSNTKKLKLPKGPSKGSIFKKEHGFSKTAKRNMQKIGLLIIEENLKVLKENRKARKLKEKQVRQEKHKTSSAYRRANSKKKGSKGSTPAPKKK